MPIFRLEGDDISNAELILAKETNLELETYLESWLQNSPSALIQDELILWIDRQPSAKDEEGTIFPDLLGVDAEGNLVIVELKRDKAPREVVAQLLEYAAWASELSEERIKEIAEDYFDTIGTFEAKHFNEVFIDTFYIPETDDIPTLNRNLRLFIVAEDIPARVARVCRFLRTSHSMDINCINVSTFQTEAGERLVSMETIVGDEDLLVSKTQRQRTSHISLRSGDKPNNDMVYETVKELMQENKEYFELKEVRKLIDEKYPNVDSGKVDFIIYSDCVGFPSRNTFPGGNDRYWYISRGKFRLYNSATDKIEGNEEGNQTEPVTENPT